MNDSRCDTRGVPRAGFGGLDAADTALERAADAGVAIEESVGIDEHVCGRRMTAHTIVTGTDVAVAAAGRRFLDALEKHDPRNPLQEAANQ